MMSLRILSDKETIITSLETTTKLIAVRNSFATKFNLEPNQVKLWIVGENGLILDAYRTAGGNASMEDLADQCENEYNNDRLNHHHKAFGSEN